MKAGCLALCCVLLASPAAAAGRLLVNPANDTPGSCASNAALAEELRRVLPHVEVVADDLPRGEDQRVHLERAEAGWAVVIERADASVALRRELPGSSEACAAAAATAALIVERHLIEVDWGGGPVELEAPPPPPPLLPETPPPAPPPAPALQSVSVSLGPGVRLFAPGALAAGGALELSMRLRPRWRVALTALMAQTSEAPVVVSGRERGTLQGLPASLLGGAGLCAGAPDALALCGGVSAGATALFTRVEGALYRKSDVALWLPAAAGWGQVARPFGRLELSLTFRVIAPLGSASAVVEGTTAELGVAPVEGTAVAAVGWKFF